MNLPNETNDGPHPPCPSHHQNLESGPNYDDSRVYGRSISKLSTLVMPWGMTRVVSPDQCTGIKADPARRSISIIAVTSYALNGEEQIARAAGCDILLSLMGVQPGTTVTLVVARSLKTLTGG